MANIHSIVLDETKKDHDYVVSLRRYLHTHPELSKSEFNTAKTIESELDKIGVSHKRVGETGVFAEINGEKQGNRVIALRADIDALPIQEENNCDYKSVNPGVMHACGHDAHAASLIGVARLLTKLKKEWGGSVRLCFQQAEEVGYGGRMFVKEGCLEGADRTFGFHTSPSYPTGVILAQEGPINASVDWFRITVHGKSAHITKPTLGVDSLLVASKIVEALHKFVPKSEELKDRFLIGIGKLEAGTTYNIIAEKAVMEGTVRAFDEVVRKQIKELIELTANSIASTFKATVSYEWRDNTSVLSNDSKATKEAQKVARELFGEDKVVTDSIPPFTGDDMADFINAVPGTYLFIGSHNEQIPQTGVAQHNCNFDIDEDVLNTSVALTTCYAIDYLSGLLD